jgi:hypothetical protein
LLFKKTKHKLTIIGCGFVTSRRGLPVAAQHNIWLQKLSVSTDVRSMILLKVDLILSNRLGHGIPCPRKKSWKRAS